MAYEFVDLSQFMEQFHTKDTGVKIEILPDPEEQPVIPKYPINVGGTVFELTDVELTALKIKDSLIRVNNHYFLDRDPEYFRIAQTQADIDTTDPSLSYELYLYGLCPEPNDKPVFSMQLASTPINGLVTIKVGSEVVLTTDRTVKLSGALLAKLSQNCITLDVDYQEIRSLINLLRTGRTYDKTLDIRKYGVFFSRSDARSAITYTNGSGDIVVVTTKDKIKPQATLHFDLKKPEIQYITDMILTIDVPIQTKYASDFAYQIIQSMVLTMNSITLPTTKDWIYVADKMFKRKLSASYDNVQLLYQSQFIPVCRIMIPVHTIGNSVVPIKHLQTASLTVTIADIPSILNCTLLCFVAQSKTPLLTHNYLAKHHVNMVTAQETPIYNTVTWQCPAGILKDLVIKANGLIKIEILQQNEIHSTYDSMILQNVYAPKYLGKRLTGAYHYLTFAHDSFTNQFSGGLHGSYAVKVYVHPDIASVDIFAQTYVQMTLN